MASILERIKRLMPGRKASDTEAVTSIFHEKYAAFKDLLSSNAELLNIMAEIEEKLQGQKVFGMSFVHSYSSRAVFHSLRMVESLNRMTGNRYPRLHDAVDEINASIEEILERRREIRTSEFILPYDKINKEMVDWVGGKNANLGEVSSRVGLPVPRGFAITTHAYDVLFRENELWDEINKIKMEVEPDDLESVTRASEDIQNRIITARVPEDLQAAILEAYSRTFPSEGPAVAVSMRSSAVGEDSELSFAGQYVSFLNVLPDRLIQTYRFILASLFTPRAIIYRMSKGIRDEDSAMSVACLEMVQSVASGVIYSRHPFNVLEDRIIINAVWGLGSYAVDGVVVPDTYVVSKGPDPSVQETTISRKSVRLVGKPDGTLEEEVVEPERQEAPCLDRSQIITLAGYAQTLERHYKGPQDVEWALDDQGKLFVLQTRPLRFQPQEEQGALPVPEGATMLVEKASVASPGVGFGPAYHVHSDEDLKDFPEGAVLVAQHSQPQFVTVMRKAQAIVANTGSVTGHMASLAREFDVPALLGTNVAMQAIAPGEEVTVDAYSGRVFRGRIKELLALQKPRESHMEDTPVYQTLKQVAQYIIPLHLFDPKSPSFSSEGCRTLHDIMRFVHEMSYKAMFQISDLVSDYGGGSVKLDARLPLDLYVIDLGGGLRDVPPGSRKISLENVTSLPFLALLRGMLHKELSLQRPRPIEWKGLLSVMSEQMLQANTSERFGDRSYALISDKYLNFSSRVGYHYAVLDSYCGQTINKNYISFSFKGGAADDVRKNRRVRAIALVLEQLDFTVKVKGDRVDTRFQKDVQAVVEKKLDLVGRLLIFTRQMDMLMYNEASVERIASCFMSEDYDLCAMDPESKARE